MKKLTLIVLVLLMALVGVVSATPIDELTTLADYAPEDALAVVTVRIDEGYVETINGVIDRLGEQLPGMLPPDLNANVLLDQIAMGVYADGSFEDTLRPWLGDTVAAIIPNLQVLNASTRPFTLVAEISDFDGAREYMDTLVAEESRLSGYTAEEQDDGSVVYTPEFSSDATIVITEEVIIVGDALAGIEPLVLPGEDTVSLTQTDAYGTVIDNMPTDDYNIFIYIDAENIYGDVVSFVGPFLFQALQGQDIDIDPTTITDAGELLGQQALGFTILEGRVLTMDYVQTGPLAQPGTPLDLSLLESVPADTPLLIQAQGIGAIINGLFDALGLLEDFLTESDVLPLDTPGLADLGPTDLGTFIRFSVEGTYGIDLDETLAWMSGDFVNYVRLPLTDASPLGVWFGMATLIATDNPESAAALVEGEAQLALNAWRTATFEDGVLTVPVGDLFSMPEALSMVTTVTDRFYITGTSDAVNYALDPSGANITESETYAFESGFFLPEPTSLFYIDLEPVRAAAEAVLEAQGEMVAEEDAEMLRALLGLLDTSSITTANADGASLARFTLTLGE